MDFRTGMDHAGAAMRRLGAGCALAAAVAAALLLAGSEDAAAAEGKCVRLIQQAGQEYIVNACETCRMVQVRRTRAGEALSTMRDYRLQSGGHFRLPFKGPGRTRVVSVLPCERETREEAEDAARVEQRLKQCVRPYASSKGNFVVNTCAECRTVVVGRTYADGSERYAEHAMEGKSFARLDPHGAITARIVHEQECTGD